MSTKLFSITMGSGYALAVDQNNQGPGGQLILASLDTNNKFQQWVWLYMPGPQASFLYSPAVQMFAVPASLNEGAGIVLQATSLSPDSSNTFQVLGGSGAAIRPPGNTDLNMNALGDNPAPGTQVALWSWGGGGANETWTSSII